MHSPEESLNLSLFSLLLFIRKNRSGSLLSLDFLPFSFIESPVIIVCGFIDSISLLSIPLEEGPKGLHELIFSLGTQPLNINWGHKK